MKGGRKHLKRAAEEVNFTLQDSQIITQVISLRGSNIIEVMDAQGGKSLAYFPAKFQKSMWIKRGSFVVVDTTGKKEAVEFGSKVTCMVTQVLFFEQVRKLKKSPEWPELFKTTVVDGTEDLATNDSVQLEEIQGEAKLEANEGEAHLGEEDDDDDDDDDEEEEDKEEQSSDDGLPPLEANTNRVRPAEMQPYSDSSGSDSDA